jgi:ADP-ribose pyrophosphatase YjhB (NUDIX family)
VARKRSEVATVVVLRGARLLLVNQPPAGVLALPGGKLEPGESAREAAARELGEETGIVVPAELLVALAERIEARDGVTLVPFALVDPPRRRRAAELHCRWLALSELSRQVLAPGVERSVEAALAALTLPNL